MFWVVFVLGFSLPYTNCRTLLSPRARQSECRRKKLDGSAFKKLQRQVMNDSNEKKNLSLKRIATEKQEARQVHLALKAANREAAKKKKSGKARK